MTLVPCIMQCSAVTYRGPKAAGQGHTQSTDDSIVKLHAVLGWGPQEVAAWQSLVLYQLLLARLWQQQTAMCSDSSGFKTTAPTFLLIMDCHKASTLHSSQGTAEEDLMPWTQQRRA